MEINESQDPEETYIRLFMFLKGGRVSEALRQMKNYIHLNEIFLSEKFFARFNKITEHLDTRIRKYTHALKAGDNSAKKSFRVRHLRLLIRMFERLVTFWLMTCVHTLNRLRTRRTGAPI